MFSFGIGWQHKHIAHKGKLEQSFFYSMSHLNAFMNQVTEIVIGDNDSTIHGSVLDNITVVITLAGSKYQIATLFKAA